MRPKGMGKVDLPKKTYDCQARRSFIKKTGMAGLGLASSSIFPGTVRSLDSSSHLHKFSTTRLAMGTFVSLTILSSSREKAKDAVELVFEEIDRLSALMNHHDSETPIARLNREGCLKDAHPDVIKVVSTALHYYRLTKGAFDISIKPVIDLFDRKFSGDKPEFPSGKEIKEALKLVGSDKIGLKGRTVRFKKAGMGISLDAIAKGYIVDKASDVLLNHGINNHLINAGGDIKTIGLRQDNTPWKIAIQDPADRNKYLDVIDLTDKAVATSVNYEAYYDEEKKYHHIVNPLTGLSPSMYSSVSVIAPTAMDADALATSVFVMTLEEGIRLLESLAGCETLIISSANQKIRSSGWKSSSV